MARRYAASELDCSARSSNRPQEIPCSSKKIPCSVAQRILLQASEFARVLAFKIGIGLANSMEFPVICSRPCRSTTKCSCTRTSCRRTIHGLKRASSGQLPSNFVGFAPDCGSIAVSQQGRRRLQARKRCNDGATFRSPALGHQRRGHHWGITTRAIIGDRGGLRAHTIPAQACCARPMIDAADLRSLCLLSAVRPAGAAELYSSPPLIGGGPRELAAW